MRIKMLCITAVVFAASIAMVAQADKQTTYANGSAQGSGAQSHGTDQVGNQSHFDGQGSFAAEGSHNTTGVASVNGQAVGNVMSTDGKFATGSSAKVDSFGASSGKKNYDTAAGNTGQSNWGTVDKGDGNSAGGWNGSKSGFSGEIENKQCDPKVSGKAVAGGTTTGSVTETANSNASRLETSGGAAASLAFQGHGEKTGSVYAAGDSAGGVGSSLSGPGFSAGAGAGGAAGFNATGQSNIRGHQNITADSATKATANGVQASSTVISTASTQGH